MLFPDHHGSVSSFWQRWLCGYAFMSLDQGPPSRSFEITLKRKPPACDRGLSFTVSLTLRSRRFRA